MLQRIDIDADDMGFSYRLTYSDGEQVTLNCLEDVLHYLECNSKGISPTDSGFLIFHPVVE